MGEANDIAAWIRENWQLDLILAVWWQRLTDAGYAQPTWPVGLGGVGATHAQARRIGAELAAAGAIAGPGGNGPNMAGPTILAHATAEQKQRFIPPMASGHDAWAQLFSEPGAGSDLASLSTSAVRDGDEFIINGQKVWNSFADVSDWGMLLARTNPDAPKHRGISWMVIDMNQPGVDARPLRQMNGVAEFCEVFLTDARVPVANVIGELNDGWAVTRTTLAFERANAGAGRVRNAVNVGAGQKSGNLQRTVGDLIEQAQRQREEPTRRNEVLLSSRTIIELAREMQQTNDPIVRQRLARYHSNSQVYTWTGQRGADNAKSGRPGPEASTMKLQLANLAHESRDLSLSLLGPEATLVFPDARHHGRVQRAGLSSFAASLGGGTDQIQRNIIGEHSLGLPREPAVDQGIPFREMRRS